MDHLQRTFSSKDDAVTFLYCNYKEREQQTVNNLVSSLIRQLIDQIDFVPEDLSSLYKSRAKHGTRPSRFQLHELLISTASHFSTLFLVIDALDECSESDGTRSFLASDLRKMLPHARFLFTSRPYNDIESHFDGCLQIEIRAGNDDIRRYITSQILREPRLAKHIQADKSLLELIKETIIRRSDGMLVDPIIYTLIHQATSSSGTRSRPQLPDGSIKVMDYPANND